MLEKLDEDALGNAAVIVFFAALVIGTASVVGMIWGDLGFWWRMTATCAVLAVVAMLLIAMIVED